MTRRLASVVAMYCLCFIFNSLLHAQLSPVERELTLRTAPIPIILDGEIDEQWRTADSSDSFVQHNPAHGKPPSRRTVAKVLTSGRALYCLVICYEDGDAIQAYAGYLDNAGGDFVSIMLDTFGDRKSAYRFAVSAGGARSDARLLDDGRNRDYSWDGVWFASSKVYDWGYVVEMEIPYRSIQYDPKLASWGLDFDRWIPGRTEDIYWCAYSENEGLRISKFGRLMFDQTRPTVSSLSLECYPVAIGRMEYVRDGVYRLSPDAGLDVFYNPSPILTLQATANPDFAQIEADPFSFNISRYESYFSERRPFFTEGNEIFMASGKQHNSGFYQPLELFYPRRIGKKLADGQEVPLYAGAKAFGRLDTWEYGGFVARTGEVEYTAGENAAIEPGATFAAARVKRRVLDNSDIGFLYVGKWGPLRQTGVLDIDGALRGSSWQLAWQLARSFDDATNGGYAASASMTRASESWIVLTRGRAIDKRFDVSQVGFVPWKGTATLVALTGPNWYIKDSPVRQIYLYGGGGVTYEDVDLYTDLAVALGGNITFRANYGGEINLSYGSAKDQGRVYTSYEASLWTWYSIHPRWNANLWGGYSRTWNFTRDWLAFYSWAGVSMYCRPTGNISLGIEVNSHFEGNPDNRIEDVIINSRPSVTVNPINNISVRLYVDNTYRHSSRRVEQWITGLLFSWNFLPKSWVYFAINDLRDLQQQYGPSGIPQASEMRVRDQAAVLKIKYLYYL